MGLQPETNGRQAREEKVRVLLPERAHKQVFKLKMKVISETDSERGVTKQKFGQDHFLMQTVIMSYKLAAGKIWGEGEDPGGLGGRSAFVIGLSLWFWPQ